MRVREPGFRLVWLPLMPETAGVDDADLDRVLIGGRERRDIVIADYDASWPRRFEVERNRIAGALGSRALRIEHIGSTAVPGLAAKPIVDILVDVARLEDADLARAGYVLRVREDDHRMFRTPELDRKSTRLNSSHQIISYAVFCLKKKTKKHTQTTARKKEKNRKQHKNTTHKTH